MADFELNLSDGSACTGSVAGVQLRGFALNSREASGRQLAPELVDTTVPVEDFVRTIDDISRVAAYVEEDLVNRGITGPLLGLLATQVCTKHRETTNDARRNVMRLERLGAWFLPTADVFPSDPLEVALEQPSPRAAWVAYVKKLGSDGKPLEFDPPVRPSQTAHFASPLRGISIPRTPAEKLHSPLSGAILLASVKGGDVYGLLHRAEGQTYNIEQIIPPAEPGQRFRPSMGTIDTRVPSRY